MGKTYHYEKPKPSDVEKVSGKTMKEIAKEVEQEEEDEKYRKKEELEAAAKARAKAKAKDTKQEL
jgi:hypothetical protein